MNRADVRRGVVVGDVLLVLSVLALALALAYPRIQRTAARERVAQATADVQAVVDAAERFLAEEGRWPGLAESGVAPPELAPYLPEGVAFARAHYELDFQVWETAEEVPPMEFTFNPPVGQSAPNPDTTDLGPTTLYGSRASVTVRSADPTILAGLSAHFGGARSFVHEDRWMLVFASVRPR